MTLKIIFWGFVATDFKGQAWVFLLGLKNIK